MPSPNYSSVQLLQRGELPLLHIENAYASALIALQGAQLLTYTPLGSASLLWLSEHAEFRRGQSMRGGIPVCWPWFGDVARNADAVRQMLHAGVITGEKKAPAHGFVRTADWQIYSIAEADNDEATEVVLRYSTTNPTLSLWPHAADLQLTISVGRKLRLRLVTLNRDTKPLVLSQAFHTYLAISDINRVDARGLDDCRYIDTLDEWREHRQQGDLRFTAETDRIYCDTRPQLQLRDEGWQRTIHLRATNSTSAVVWNPWIEKSRRLSQFAPDAWQRMVCIETANVLDDHLMLAPGAAHSLELELWSEPLSP